LALRDKQAAFVNEYLIDFNATRAAERAGYTGSDATLASVGWENLRKPEIAEAIKKRLNEAAMTADEVLMRLAAQGRADMGRWLTDDGELDIAAMKRDRATHLIHKIRRTERSGETNSGGNWNQVTTEIELHPAQSALVTLGKHHKLWTEQVEQSGEIIVKVQYGDDNVNSPSE
jgi:phage terminase small subunit